MTAAIELSSGAFLLSTLYKWITLQEACVYPHNNKIVYSVIVTAACSHSSAPDQVYTSWITVLILKSLSKDFSALFDHVKK